MNWSGYEAVAFSSANGVKALVRADVPVPGRLPCFCVGERTAAAAREAGFTDVFTARHTLESLADLIRTSFQPLPAKQERPHLLHLRGEVAADDLDALIGRSDITIEPLIVYRTRPAPDIELDLKHFLEQNAARTHAEQIDAITLYSPRTAALFADLVNRTATAHHLKTVIALCLSSAIADHANALPFKSVVTAATPSTEALIDLINAREMW